MAEDVVPLGMLGPLLSAARKALRELETSDVPVPVRKAAASSAERLPPPLARALVREIDGNDWLRAKVLEEWTTGPPPGPPDAIRASHLFIERPEGWEADLSRLVSQKQEVDLSAELERLRTKQMSLQEDLEASRRKARAEQRRAEAAEKAATRAARSETGEAKRALAERDAHIAGLTKTLGEAQRLKEVLERRVSDSESRVSSLRRELLRARRAQVPEDPAAPSAWSLRDPMALARHLDDLAESFKADSSEQQASVETQEPSVAIPPGIRPDRREAIDWLLEIRSPYTLVVDGYNAAFHLDATRFHTPELRTRLNQALKELRRRSSAPARVIVVYDSDRGLPQEAPGSESGIDVRFTVAGVLADEEILSLVSRLEGQVVAVSSDRVVREGAEELGALGLWSEALAAWISRSPAGTTWSQRST